MLIRNVTEEDLKLALDETNTQYDDNLKFVRIDSAGKNRFRVRLGVKNSKEKGARISYMGRMIPSACWHAHGDFFDNLLDISPDTVIIAGPDKITKDSGNWVDRNIGSMLSPLYHSEACSCHQTPDEVEGFKQNLKNRWKRFGEDIDKYATSEEKEFLSEDEEKSINYDIEVPQETVKILEDYFNELIEHGIYFPEFSFYIKAKSFAEHYNIPLQVMEKVLSDWAIKRKAPTVPFGQGYTTFPKHSAREDIEKYATSDEKEFLTEDFVSDWEKKPKYKVDMRKIRDYQPWPHYMRLVRDAVENGDGVVVILDTDKDKGLVKIAGSYADYFLGGPWVPEEALTPVRDETEAEDKPFLAEPEAEEREEGKLEEKKIPPMIKRLIKRKKFKGLKKEDIEKFATEEEKNILAEVKKVGSANIETLEEAGYEIVELIKGGEEVILRDKDSDKYVLFAVHDSPISGWQIEHKGSYLEFVKTIEGE